MGGFESQGSCTAFAGERRIASGGLEEVARGVKEVVDGGETRAVLIFNDVTSERVEIDFQGTVDEVVKRLACRATGAAQAEEVQVSRGPGRPRLGVVGREVTLLPRHWEWLSGQPGGASVALRRLVEQARRTHEGKDRKRRAQEAAYRFMSDMVGDLPGFEEALRALYRGERERFAECVAGWPVDVREHAKGLSEECFDEANPS